MHVTQIATVPKVSNLLVDADLDLSTFRLKAPYVDTTELTSLVPAGVIYLNNNLDGTGYADVLADTITAGTALAGAYSPANIAAGTIKGAYFKPERYTSSTTYNRKIPEFLVTRAGVVRVGLQVKSNGGGYWQIMRDDAAVTADEWINNAAYQTLTRDVTVTAGQRITVHMKKNVADCYIQEFWLGTASDALGACILTLPDVASS